MSFQVGQSVGNYRILKELGAGGMGQVFLAEHPLIGKHVALKVIHSDLALNKEVVARFVTEAKAVSAIGNDHIVEIHDFGTSAEGAHFFIMEYLQGPTLATIAKQHVLSIADSLHIAAQIASGLASAHDKNIIHRDLKPDNIMLIEKLGDPYFVKILDFGLAKMLEADQQLTGVGVVLGTPEFMSPEAAESKGVDGRSDIYSFGVLLFQMLTGRLPFEAQSMGEMMVQHVCKPPPAPRGINPAISPSVEQIILRCLAKLQEERFQSMHELHAALLDPEGYLQGSPQIVQSDGAQSAISRQHPAMARPALVDHHTMRIGTPTGFLHGRGRRTFALALVALLSAGGGAGAALLQDKPEALGAGLAASAVDADASGATTETAAAEEPETAPPVEFSLMVTSNPTGAEVTDETGALVGTTPFELTAVADAGEMSWRFAAEGHDSTTYRFEPKAQTPVAVSLLPSPQEAVPKTTAGRRPRVKSKSQDRPRAPKDQKVGDNVMTPNF